MEYNATPPSLGSKINPTPKFLPCHFTFKIKLKENAVSFEVEIKSSSSSFYMWIKHYPHFEQLALYLRHRGLGIFPSYYECGPGYFHWKIEEKQNQKKSLAV